MFTRRQMLATSAASVLPIGTHPTLGVAAEGDAPRTDYRLGKNKDLNGYFPLIVPKTKEAWLKRRERIREQVLVATGLWPLPEKTALNPVIYGAIEREHYTVEKVYFASTPGHYVTGNLYRPKAKPAGSTGKYPVVLCPHGHWGGASEPQDPKAELKTVHNGRLWANSDAGVEQELKSGAEKTKEGARYPLQARCAQLARMGFYVFFYDMIGYADSQAVKHIAKSGVPARDGFADAESELRLQSLLGLQTWNSIRALDFLLSLPNADEKRVGVTGASGGGSQTFLLAAVDDRVQAAFPAVMVSTAMQGGCVCENCSLLRVGTGNIELAGLFAPKPLAMSAANDWTKEILTKGLPELKQLYKLFGAEDNVAAKAWVEFPHNYNQVAREFMYSWFSKHLLGKEEAITEAAFVPVPPKELEVYDDKHPRPKDELPAAALRKKLTAASDDQLAKLVPNDAKSLETYRRLLAGALRAMICDELPADISVLTKPAERKVEGGFTLQTSVLGRTDEPDALPTAKIFTPKFQDQVVIWVHPKGQASLLDGDKPATEVARLCNAGFAVIAPDVLGVGGLNLPKGFEVNKTYAGFTYGYNRSLAAHRVHDILTTVAFARSTLKAKTIHIIGWDSLGPVAALARAAAGGAVLKLAADLNQFNFASVKTTDDPMMLPGALKYGGLPAFLSLAAPAPLLVHNLKGTASLNITKTVYDLTGKSFKRVNLVVKPEEVIDWILA